jgi:fatty acid desaturase
MVEDGGGVDHRQAIAAIAVETRSRLLRQSDARGLLQLGLHWGLIAALMVYVALGLPLWCAAMLPLGILIMFQFTALHEVTHGTAFRSAWLNVLVAHVSGFLTLVQPEWFRYFHFAHHRHTQDPEHDPELEGGKPETLAKYLIYLSGYTVWKGNLTVLVRNALGRADWSYVPEKRRPALVREARWMLSVYAVLIIVSMWLWSDLLVWLWLVPVLLGQPFLRAYLLAEHTRCPFVSNMLENSRTTFTTALVRFVAWNMPYHSEHHSWPQVPFWRLPELHRVLKDKVMTTEHGYARVHAKFLSQLIGRWG